MSLADFERLLKDTIGIDVESIGVSAIERAVSERQAAGRFGDRLAYWNALQSSDSERQSLVESVVVPETWFFRDRGAFDALASVATREWTSARAEKPFRVLSVPCSSGEEPYSIAMTLHEAGLQPFQCRIDAADVSHRSLAKGRQGLYGDNSFRGADLAFRDRYFTRTAQGYQILDAIREQVHFHQGNLLSPTFLANADPYDAIFCRNLFIYFDRATQQRAIAALTRLLAPEGLLFVGSSESGVFMDQSFTSANLPKAFAFQRRGAEATNTFRARAYVARATVERQPAAIPFAVLAKAARLSTAPGSRSQVVELAASAKPRATLDEAHQLADQGHFAEAAKLCDDQVRREGPSARAFYLLGLVRDASGNDADAELFYRKALYLDPGHHEALMHLALLMDRQGNAAGAQVLRNRVRRLAART